MNTWDDVLDALKTYESTALAARILFANSQPDLACMMLRDALRTDSKFAHSTVFVELCSNPALVAYLFPADTMPAIVKRLSTQL